MKKIPTLFRRDPDDPRRVLPEVTEGCEWVLAGEGVATRKYDGTCMFIDGQGDWWARREVKPGKKPPDNYCLVEVDQVTGKMVGWEPVDQTGWVKYLEEALRVGLETGLSLVTASTYELCGPKVNRNPEHFGEHRLIRHADAELVWHLELLPDRTVEEHYAFLRGCMANWPHEGIVWHHRDGRMAKLKARDFPASHREDTTP